MRPVNPRGYAGGSEVTPSGCWLFAGDGLMALPGTDIELALHFCILDIVLFRIDQVSGGH
jgi:hypothetical protein